MGHRGEEDNHYPPPLASHEDLVKDPNVFWDTLRRFHFLMATKFMIPVIGGKELDLHVLYVEVTRRCGYQKVVAEKKWREVDAASASNHSWRPDLAIVQYSPKPIEDHLDSNAEDSSFIFGEGTIDGKFECGYLVSVKLGCEVLRGVLYHPDPSVPPPQVQQYENAIVPFSNNNKPGSSGRRRKNKRRWDPNYPKPNRSGYNFYFAEKHYKLKELYPNREREFTKMIGQSWNCLSSEERMVYQNIGLKDKERYKREVKEYKEKMMVGQTETKRP
ncbi:hypothetical protein TanjilG_09725 [Lupinus angustifolius]|uniref:HMG box domain-containing protein n=1 Tax=Lupinus angustifolius TaxID=3871 RepID=A0A4P1QWE0_LUPAN|nr:hypothetical protein TanjilG_09725 [Lupinus angustifolius]